MRGLVLLGVLLAGVFAGVGRVGNPSDGPLPGAEVYRRTLAGTAWVQATDRGKGTGWIIDRERRWLITCYHVVGENETVEVVFPIRRADSYIAQRRYYVEHLPRLSREGYAVRGRVLRRSTETDLALVELDSLPPETKELPLAEVGASPGDRVHVVGNRYDLDVLWVHGMGAVRQVRVLRDGYFNGGRQLAKGARVLVAQTPINEGDSGAALVNERGEVVGVAAAVAWEAQGAGLFIDVRAVRALVGPRGKRASGPLAAMGREIYRRGVRSLALIQYKGVGRSSGVLLDSHRRLVLTTAEAVGREETVDVTFPVQQGGRVVAEASFYAREKELLRRKGALTTGVVLATDARRNLALVEVANFPEGVAGVTLSRSRPAPGDSLHTISNPRAFEVLWVYGAGSVRQVDHVNLGQTMDGPDPLVVIVQAPLVEGEAGGPLLDERGELVGLVSGKVGPQQQLVYGLDREEIEAFLNETRPRSSPRTAAEFCQRGVLFVKARQYGRALRDFHSAIRLDPRHAPAWSERGRVYHLQGNLDRALADCNEALRLNDRLTQAYCHRAAVWCSKGEPGKALPDCDRALRLDPRCALAHARRGQAHLLRRQWVQALADCDEAIWLDRKLALAHLYRGRAYAGKDQQDRAVADYSQALRLDEHLAEAHRRRGDSYWAKSDVAAALADYNQALMIDPRDAHAHLGRGRARGARGDHQGALADFNAALRLDSRLAPAYEERAGVHFRRKEWLAGVADVVRAILINFASGARTAPRPGHP
jgi:tetratricopeptide (TPR) repeat protein/S1-C subfamily serine protease